MAVRFAKLHTVKIQLSQFQYERLKELKALSTTKGETYSTIVADALSKSRAFR